MAPLSPPKPLRLVAFVVGTLLVGLIVADVVVQMKGVEFGRGVNRWMEAENTMAFFFLGLILGVLAGIGIFFAHLVAREKRQEQEKDELAVLFEEVSQEEDLEQLRWGKREGAAGENREESDALEPWEKGADWWKEGEA